MPTRAEPQTTPKKVTPHWAYFLVALVPALTGCGSAGSQPDPHPTLAVPTATGARPHISPAAPILAATAPTAPPQTPTAPKPEDLPTANVDPLDDLVVGPPEPIADCEERLRAAGVTFRTAQLPIVKKRDSVCGAHQAVQYLKGPTGIRFEPNPVVSCPLALGLARFEPLIQRLAQEKLGHRVTRVIQGGTYNCRSMARFKLASEHSYGNAIDLYQFVFDNGSRANVLKDFGATESPPKNVRGEFLRELAQAAFDEKVFSVVVTRFFDELHRDHLHVDMAHYRTDGTR